MDHEEVTRLVVRMKLAKEVGEKVMVMSKVAQTNQNRRQQFMVGKVFDSCVVNKDTLRTHLLWILKLRRETDIEIVGDNLFAIGFTSQEDRKHAIWDGSWHFFKSLMIFEETVGLQHPTDMIFDEFSTWIQLHNLPLACMQPKIIRSIGETVGRVEEVDTNENESCLGQFTRVRISRKLEEPLQRCVSVVVEGSEEQRIILIRYERLLDFCYACGRVGHVVRHYDDEGMDKVNHDFGQWLRASRVLELMRHRSGPTDSRPWKEGSESNYRSIKSGLNPTVSEGSKKSGRDGSGLRDDDKLQIVLFEGVGGPEVIGAQIGKDMSLGREKELGENGVNGLHDQAGGDQNMAGKSMTMDETTVDEKREEKLMTPIEGYERRWKKRARLANEKGGDQEVDHDSDNKRKVMGEEQTPRLVKHPR